MATTLDTESKKMGYISLALRPFNETVKYIDVPEIIIMIGDTVNTLRGALP